MHVNILNLVLCDGGVVDYGTANIVPMLPHPHVIVVQTVDQEISPSTLEAGGVMESDAWATFLAPGQHQPVVLPRCSVEIILGPQNDSVVPCIPHAPRQSCNTLTVHDGHDDDSRGSSKLDKACHVVDVVMQGLRVKKMGLLL